MSFYTEEQIKGYSLQYLLSEYKLYILNFQYKPHPDHQKAIKEIEQEINLRFSKLENKLNDIKFELKGPLCASYEYDSNPTAEEKLRKINNIISKL